MELPLDGVAEELEEIQIEILREIDEVLDCAR